MIEIVDDLLEPHVAEYIDMQMRDVRWKYDYESKRGQLNKHWHVLCGHSPKEVVEKGFEWVQPVWDTAKYKLDFETKYRVDDYVRIYLNAHTHGIEPHLHHDDGDFTMIYYPRLDWKPEWLGGTVIWNGQKNEINKYVNYIGNRLFVFDASLPHQAMAVSRQCYQLRTCVVFKTFRSDANSERLDFYA